MAGPVNTPRGFSDAHLRDPTPLQRNGTSSGPRRGTRSQPSAADQPVRPALHLSTRAAPLFPHNALVTGLRPWDGTLRWRARPPSKADKDHTSSLPPRFLPADRPSCPISHRRAPIPLMNWRFGSAKPPDPPQSSIEKFLSSKPNNQGLVATLVAASGALTFSAKVLDDDLIKNMKESIKPLAADVAAVKNDLAAVSASLTEIKSDVSSLKTSTAFVSYNFAALDVLVVAGLVIALYMINQENKKLSEELAGFNKKKR